MAFKMKGFPYKSGFKHTGGSHEDHHQNEIKESTGELPNEQKENKDTVQESADIIRNAKSEIERMTRLINDPKYTGSQKEGFKRKRAEHQAMLTKLGA
jgi:hypothetical protein